MRPELKVVICWNEDYFLNYYYYYLLTKQSQTKPNPLQKIFFFKSENNFKKCKKHAVVGRLCFVQLIVIPTDCVHKLLARRKMVSTADVLVGHHGDQCAVRGIQL